MLMKTLAYVTYMQCVPSRTCNRCPALMIADRRQVEHAAVVNVSESPWTYSKSSGLPSSFSSDGGVVATTEVELGI